MNSLFVYVISRDYGFAPNPFHGFCTLATCKPSIRGVAKVGDWIIGMAGSKLKSTGKCIYAMQVSAKMTLNEYWIAPQYRIKRPIRNGSKIMVVGDNIYSKTPSGTWIQADSHHSNADGSTNQKNLRTDTSKDAVLIGENFIYFGRGAVEVPLPLLDRLNYKNPRSHRRFKFEGAAIELVSWLLSQRRHGKQKVLADPFNFQTPGTRYNPKPQK